MEEKIKKALAEDGHGLTIDDLTQEELEELKEEIIAKEKGFMILDGVLSNPAILYRRLRPKGLQIYNTQKGIVKYFASNFMLIKHSKRQ